MARNFIDGKIKIEKREYCTVDVTFEDGTKYEKLLPKKLFPTSNSNEYISLLNSDNDEICILRSVENLEGESKKALVEALEECFRVPTITKIYELTDKFGLVKMDCETNLGRVRFTVKNRQYSIKKMSEKKFMVIDVNDNRYIIEDYYAMDKQSRAFMYSYI